MLNCLCDAPYVEQVEFEPGCEPTPLDAMADGRRVLLAAGMKLYKRIDDDSAGYREWWCDGNGRWITLWNDGRWWLDRKGDSSPEGLRMLAQVIEREATCPA